MAGKLYKLTFCNGKSYIGQTVRTMKKRMTQHRYTAKGGSLLAVHCAWRKHGEPTVEVIGEYEDQDDLHAAEIAAIRDMNTRIPNGYNLSYGGETAPSRAPEVASKIGLKSRGRKQNPAVKSAASLKMWQDDEYRERNTAAVRKAWENEGLRKAASERFKAMWAKRKADGWVMPEETREKMAKKLVSEESRAKMSAAARARKRAPMAPETRAKMSAATKAAWQNAELTERRIAAIRAARQKPQPELADENQE